MRLKSPYPLVYSKKHPRLEVFLLGTYPRKLVYFAREICDAMNGSIPAYLEGVLVAA